MPLSPLAGTMRQLMNAYHDEMQARVEATVNDLQLRWQPVKRSLFLQIQRLEEQMLAAERAGDKVTLAWLTQAARLAELKAAVQGDVSQFAQQLRQLIGQAQQDAAQLGSTAAQEALAASVPPGMNYTFGVPPRDVLDQIAGAVQPHSPLSTLFDEYGAQAAYNAQQALFTSVALGEGARQAAQRLVWATDMSAQRAEVIARTEIMRSWRGAQMANYRANSDVVEQWMWSCDISPRSCGACLGMDGTLHDLSEELDDHVCGRCAAVPVTKPWSQILAGTGIPDDELAALDQMSATRAAGASRQTGSEWFAQQSPETQAHILGPAKAAAYQAGDLTLSDLVDYSHSSQWGMSLREASMRDLGLDAQKYLRMARSGVRIEPPITETVRAEEYATGSEFPEPVVGDSASNAETLAAPPLMSDNLPFTLEQFASAKLTPLSDQLAGVNDAYTARIGGQKYLIKSTANAGGLMSDVGDLSAAQYQAIAEATATRAADLLGFGQYMTPTYYLEANGETYVAAQYLTNVKPWSQIGFDALAQQVPEAQLRDMVLQEYVVGDIDRNMGNYLLNAQTGDVYMIDQGFAFKPEASATVDSLSTAAWTWNTQANSMAFAGQAGWANMTLDAAQLQQIAAQESQIIALLQQQGLDAAIPGVEARMAVLRETAALPDPTYADLQRLGDEKMLTLQSQQGAQVAQDEIDDYSEPGF